MASLIKIKSDINQSQALPFIKKVAKADGLIMCIDSHFKLAWKKFKIISLICEQNGLQYWVNRDFRIALNIHNKSITYN